MCQSVASALLAKSKHYSSTVMLEKLFLCVLSARYSKCTPNSHTKLWCMGATCYTWVILNIIFSKKNYMAPAMPEVNSLPGFYFVGQ